MISNLRFDYPKLVSCWNLLWIPHIKREFDTFWPMHYTPNIIIPTLSLLGRPTPNKDFEMVQGYKISLKKIYKDVRIAMDIHEKFGAFVQSINNFLDPLAIDEQVFMDLITLWGYHCGDSIHLSTLATRLFSGCQFLII